MSPARPDGLAAGPLSHRAPSSARWKRLQQEHLATVERFVAQARSLSSTRWSAEPSPGKWSPAQVTEHVALTYQALLQELSAGQAMRVRTTGWHRILLRALLLPRILRTGRIPSGSVAPRELRPGTAALDQAALLEQLRSSAWRLDAELAAHAFAHLTHPYFGRLRSAEVLRFCAIHTAHHAKQLPETA